MKKTKLTTVLLPIFLILIMCQLRAQQYEMRISSGKYSITHIFNTVFNGESGLGYNVNNPTYKSINKLFSVGLNKNFKKISLGLNFTFDNSNVSYSGTSKSTNRLNVFSLNTEFTYNYYNYKNKFIIYGLLGSGLSYYSMKRIPEPVKYNSTQLYDNDGWGWGNLLEFPRPNTKFYPTVQFSPIAFKYGKKLGGFIELGFGYKGVFNGGLFYKF
jgi:hypothetical protein